MADRENVRDIPRPKRNFRYDAKRWRRAQAKSARMRRAGYDIDMTRVLTAATDQFVSESDEQTAERLELVKRDGSVGIYRRPAARDAQ